MDIEAIIIIINQDKLHNTQHTHSQCQSAKQRNNDNKCVVFSFHLFSVQQAHARSAHRFETVSAPCPGVMLSKGMDSAAVVACVLTVTEWEQSDSDEKQTNRWNSNNKSGRAVIFAF